MLKKLAPILFIFFLSGCTSSPEKSTEKSPTAGNYHLHANVEHGVENIVIALEKSDTLYHLFYSTGSDQWGQIISSDLQNWQSATPVDLEYGEDGALAFDFTRDKGLPASWNRLEQKDDQLFLFTSTDGITWQAFNEKPVLEGVKGNIRITRDASGKRWLLTEAGSEGKINIYQSTDWYEWSSLGSLMVKEPFNRSAVFPINKEWILKLEGEQLSWRKLTLANGQFQLQDASPITSFHGMQRAATYQDINETLFIATHAAAVDEAVPTFGTPFQLLSDTSNITLDQPADLKALLIAKRRGLLSKLTAQGPSQFTLRLPGFDEMTRVDLLADSTRILSFFVDKREKQVTLDRSLYPLGKTQSIKYPWTWQEGPLQLDVLIDNNTFDVLLNKGQSFSATFHSGLIPQITRIKIFTDNEVVDPPGVLLSYTKKKF